MGVEYVDLMAVIEQCVLVHESKIEHQVAIFPVIMHTWFVRVMVDSRVLHGSVQFDNKP